MSIPVITPQSPSFGTIRPGGSAERGVRLDNLPSNALVTARIEQGPVAFALVGMTSFQWRVEAVDPGELLTNKTSRT
jgi:hypothetical protein